MYEFYLNTAKGTFEGWLSRETADNWIESYGNGVWCQFRGMHGGGRPGLWAIDALLVINQGPGGVNQAWSMDGYVTLDLLTLSAERLRVRAQCLPCFSYDGLGEKFLADLVERICRDYPEAVADVTGSPAASAGGSDAGSGAGLPPVTDAIDQFILKLVTADPDLSDTQVAAQLRCRNNEGLPFSRQAINVRRRKLEAMGYTVR